jgi:hypothetical protein
MSDIFREVDEDVRREKAANLWKRYQTPVLATAVLIVAATGAYSYYQQTSREAAEAANLRYDAAVALSAAGKDAEAVAAFQAIAKEGPKGYETLARLRLAEAFAKTDSAKAAAELDQVAQDKSVDKLTQEVAKLRAAMLTLEAGDRQKMADRFGELITANGPFRYTAQEIIGIDSLNDGDYDEAQRVFDLILTDQEAPHSMRQRAAAYQALLNAARGSKKPAASAPAPAAPAPAESEPAPAPEAPAAEAR